ncbi:hypothetical protein [Enterococcus sp. DIV2324]|uniref:hypothetical protein n=1 Tax=Enterococcus sp. DIV2324 TaxID=2774763 RepID=UPI003F1F7D56
MNVIDAISNKIGMRKNGTSDEVSRNIKIVDLSNMNDEEIKAAYEKVWSDIKKND